MRSLEICFFLPNDFSLLDYTTLIPATAHPLIGRITAENVENENPTTTYIIICIHRTLNIESRRTILNYDNGDSLFREGQRHDARRTLDNSTRVHAQYAAAVGDFPARRQKHRCRSSESPSYTYRMIKKRTCGFYIF